MIQTVEVKPIKTRVNNVYNVPAKQWNKWSTQSRKLFNFMMRTCTVNRPVITATDLFGSSEQTNKVLNATIWNLAWEAADYLKRQEKGK